jgi:hypothetical protein
MDRPDPNDILSLPDRSEWDITTWERGIVLIYHHCFGKRRAEYAYFDRQESEYRCSSCGAAHPDMVLMEDNHRDPVQAARVWQANAEG